MFACAAQSVCVCVGLCLSVCQCVCVQVFMGPCSARSCGSDHSSSHKMTFSRQELCVLVCICSPQ